MPIDAELFASFEDLCAVPASDGNEAQSIMDLLAEIILNELQSISHEDCELYCYKFVKSLAYQRDPGASRELVVKWLESTDLLHTDWIMFLGHILEKDLNRCTTHLHTSESSLHILTSVIWTYRYTQPRVVRLYLSILYNYFGHAQTDEDALTNCINSPFINYLYWLVCEKDEDDNLDEDSLAKEALTLLVALNDQYMLHDLRGDENPVFHTLEIDPNKYVNIGGALVLLFNRCDEYDQNLKIFTAKFFYLLFTCSSTTDLLYTNDLDVLSEVLIRELNDLPTNDVDVRAMYLRLLFVMAKNSTMCETNTKIRSVLVQLLRLTAHNARDIEPEEDSREIIRLAERCLSVEWLQWNNEERNSQPHTEHALSDSDSEFDEVEQMRHSEREHNFSDNDDPEDTFSDGYKITAPASPARNPPRTRLLVPPPPPPPRPNSAQGRHNSVVSLESIKAVDHLRPPLPPRRKIS